MSSFARLLVTLVVSNVCECITGNRNFTEQTPDATNVEDFSGTKHTDDCPKAKFSYHGKSILNYYLFMEFCDRKDGSSKYMSQICYNKDFSHNEYYNVTYLAACHQDEFRTVCDANKTFIPWRISYNPQRPGSFLADFRAQNDMELVNMSCRMVKEFLDAAEPKTLKNDSSSPDVFIPVDYSEIYNPYIPFCRNFACGQGRLSAGQLSVRDCLPRECKAVIAFVMFFDGILALLTIVSNALVLVVAARTRIMRNVPGYFKISLALGDLTVGVFVLPFCIFVTYAYYLRPMPFRGAYYEYSITVQMAQSMAHFIGFSTIMSFAISVYTMAVASVDRYLAVTKPFRYSEGRYLTKRRSAWALFFIWLLALVIAAFPIFIRARYGISALNIVLPVGGEASILFATTLVVPLLIVWILNCAMFKQLRACEERRNHSRSSSVATNYSQRVSRSMSNDVVKSKLSTGNIKYDNRMSFEITENADRTAHISCAGQHPSACEKSHGTAFDKAKRKSKRMYNSVKKNIHRRASGLSLKSANGDRSVARTLAVMIGAFTVALVPSIATLASYAVLANVTTPKIENYLASAIYLASRFLLSNSFWNCIIYSVRNKQFRRAVWTMFVCRKKGIGGRTRRTRLPG